MNTSATHPLCDAPLWQATDLGKPVPDSAHATSVCLPHWAHVVGYEEGDPAIVDAMQCGYPRFVFHPLVRELFDAATREYADAGEQCFVLPSAQAAADLIDFLTAAELNARTVAYGDTGLVAVVFVDAAFDTAKSWWQHFGAILGSRRALAVREGRAGASAEDRHDENLRMFLAELAGDTAENVYLYSSGMGALASALRTVQSLQPSAKSIQLGFPYVDGLKMQQVRGAGVHYLPMSDESDWKTLENLLQSEAISGVFCEVPGNPVLTCIDVPRLSALLRPYKVPLTVDDTIATFANVDVRHYADMIASSLTKTVSGVGDVMAGSVILSAESPLHARLTEAHRKHYENLLWHEDAAILLENAQDFLPRMAQMNETTEALCDWLKAHPAVASVNYPKYVDSEAYNAIRRRGGGYGGLFSMVLKNPEATTARFHDALRVTKGPSLGTNYTLVCPYTLLAHYKELDWAESCGVSRWIVRVSVGLEDTADLIARFDAALATR